MGNCQRFGMHFSQIVEDCVSDCQRLSSARTGTRNSFSSFNPPLFCWEIRGQKTKKLRSKDAVKFVKCLTDCNRVSLPIPRLFHVLSTENQLSAETVPIPRILIS